MSKWQWAFGNVLVSKFKWAVTAGDQDPESEDDKKCGDHFIDKDLECHDGDAHRPDPGNNPYFQGGRKGPPGKDESGKGKSEDGSRDRSEVTKKAKKKESDRETPTTPESMADWADDRLREYMEETETAHRDAGDGFTWESEQGAMKLHELAEKTIRDTAREHAGQLDTRKSRHQDPEDTRSDPGVKHREMFRREGKPITFDEPQHGTPVHVPKAPGTSVFKDLINRVQHGDKARKTLEDADPGYKEGVPDPDRKGAVEHTKNLEKEGTDEGGPSSEMVDEQDKWGGPGYEGEEAPEKKGDKGYEFQDRQVDEWDPEQSPDEAKPYMQKERRRQTQKDYKRKKDAGKSADPVEEKFQQLSPDKKKKFVQWIKQQAKKGTMLEDDIMKYMGKSAEGALANGMDWSTGSTENDLLALDSSLPPLPGTASGNETPALFPLPGDTAEGRPCGEGEDPERGHCKDPMQTGPAGPMSDDPKLLRKMGGPGGGGGGGKPPAPPKGVGLEMQEDPQRGARTATHIQVMKNSDPKDPKRTSWAINKMMGGGAVKETPKGMAGSSKPMAENLARQQYDDARHTMEQSGWQETSNMGNRTTWSKGGGNVIMQTGPSGNIGQYTNQFLVHTPKAAPKRGLFGRK